MAPKINERSGQVSDSSQGISEQEVGLMEKIPEAQQSGSQKSIIDDAGDEDSRGLVENNHKNPYPDAILSNEEAGYDQAAYDEEADSYDDGGAGLDQSYLNTDAPEMTPSDRQRLSKLQESDGPYAWSKEDNAFVEQATGFTVKQIENAAQYGKSIDDMYDDRMAESMRKDGKSEAEIQKHIFPQGKSRGPASVLDALIPSAGASDETPPKGALQLKALQDGGISASDIREWKKARVQALQDEQVPDEEIRAYFGDPQYDPKPIAKLAASINEWHPPMIKPDHEIGAKEADGILESLESGWQGSALGLSTRGKLSDITPKKDANFAEIIAHAAGSMVGDMAYGLPASFLTGAGVTGATANPALGAAAGIFAFGAVPAAVRTSLIDGYNKGGIQDSQDFVDRLTSATVHAVKEGALNLATAGAGKYGGKIAGKAVGEALGVGGAKVVAKAGSVSAEVITMGGGGPAMEGRLPEPDDFYQAAVATIGLHVGMAAAGKGASYAKGKALDALQARVEGNVKTKYQTIYKDTGLLPTQVSAMAEADPVLHAEILSGRSVDTPDSLRSHMENPPETIKITEELGPQLGGGEVQLELPMEKPAAMAAEPPKVPEGTISPEQEVQVIRKKFESVTPEQLDAMSAKEANKLVSGRLKSTPDQLGLFEELDWQESRRKLLDRYNPILQAQKMFTGTKTNKDAINAIPASKSPYLLTANMSGVAGKALVAIEHETRDFNTRNKNGESLMDITQKYRVKLLDGPKTREAKRQSAAEFQNYFAAKRIIDLAERNVNKGVDAVAAKKVVQAGEAKYGKDAKRLVAFQDRILQYAVDAGLKSPEEAAAMRAQGENYTPLNHIVEEGSGPFSSKSKLTVKDPFKKINKGSDAPIINPIESIVKNTHEIMAMAERNRVMQASRDLFATNKEVMKHVGTEAGERLFNENGESVLRFRELSKNEIAVYDEGKRNVYQVPDDLAESFRGMDTQTLGLLGKVLATSASFLRQGATKTPEFLVKNVLRDQLHAFVLSDNNYIPVVTYASGLFSMARKDKWFQNFRDGGAMGSTINSFEKNYIHSNILDVSQRTGMLKRSWNVVTSPLKATWHVLEMMSEIGEQPTRIGEYKNAAKGKTDIDSSFRAAYDARNVTIDFARRGANVAALNAIIPFFNAKNQGLDQLATALKENTARTLTKGAMLAVPSAILWAVNHKDPRYGELKDWEKTLFWHVMTDNWVPAMKDEIELGGPMLRQNPDTGAWEMNTGHILRIAKPQGMNLLFTSPLESILDQFSLDDPHGAQTMATAIINEFIPDAPQLPKLYNDMKSNYSSFRDKAIVPYFVEQRSPPFRYSPYTSEAAKWISLQMDKGGIANDYTSPPMIEYAVQGMFGGLGTHALEMVGHGLREMGLVPDNLKKKDFDELDYVKTFFTRVPESSQSADQYYKHNEEIQAPLLDAKAAEKSGNLKDLAYITGKDSFKIATVLKPTFKSAKKDLKAVKENIEMISKSDETPDDKARLIDAQMWRRTTITKAVNNETLRVKKMVAAGRDPYEAYTHETDNEADE